jgi:hypothetical protein
MRRVLVPFVALATVATTMAANFEVKVPKEGWSISFDSPSLSKKQESKKSGEYAFSASSGLFNLSLFVEKPRDAGMGNKDVYQYYWSRASQNTMIAKDTVKQSEAERYVRVQYDIVTNLGGRSIRQTNVNYYFAFQGKWVDVHISVLEQTAADEQLIATFDKSLKYGP